MNDVKIFNSPMFGELRVTRNKKGELLFCLKDVCDSLGLQVNDVAKRVGCNPDSIGVSSEVISRGVATGKFKELQMYFVTEPDLYRCIFQSRKPTARKFQDWVFNEVLPSLRTTGAFVVAKEEDSEEDIIARGLIAAKAALARREERIKELECENSQSKQVIEAQSERIAKDAPKVEYYDQTLAAENMLTTRQIANELGITPNELHNKLQQLKIIFRQSNQWLMNKPYSTWKLHGTRTYTYYDRHKDVTYSKPYLVWNQRGRRFILALYKNNFNVKLAISDINGKTAK
uniref:phage antirepressor KilAC domain-containing protein n=1 Tax=Prevotella sp. TaxID=59823 RepID=UPI004025F441